MRSAILAAMVAALCLLIATNATAGALNPPAGYACVDTAFSMPAGAWFGGFDILPNGDFVISDGSAIRVIDASGADARTLYTYESSVYGSFVKYDEAADTVYFGESSTGAIMSVAAAGGAASLLTTLTSNFDLDMWNGVPYVSADNSVYRIDSSTGQADRIAQAGPYSGPVIFDSAGNLIYGTGDDDWNTPRDQNAYLWSASDVASAGNGLVLGASDAQVLIDNCSPYGFAIDLAGDLLMSETTYPSVVKVLSEQGLSTLTSPTDAYASITYARFNRWDGSFSVAVSSYDQFWNQVTVISTLVPTPAPVPEPGTIVSLLVMLAGSVKLLRLRRA